MKLKRTLFLANVEVWEPFISTANHGREVSEWTRRIGQAKFDADG